MKEKIKEYAEKSKKFIKKHGKKIIVGVSTVLAGAVVYYLNSKDDSGNYSDSFFRNATDEELATEREKVRVEYANSGLTNKSDEEVDRLYWLLNKFDNVMSKRAWNGEEPTGPVHTEHGWYLSEDDD